MCVCIFITSPYFTSASFYCLTGQDLLQPPSSLIDKAASAQEERRFCRNSSRRNGRVKSTPKTLCCKRSSLCAWAQPEKRRDSVSGHQHVSTTLALMPCSAKTTSGRTRRVAKQKFAKVSWGWASLAVKQKKCPSQLLV